MKILLWTLQTCRKPEMWRLASSEVGTLAGNPRGREVYHPHPAGGLGQVAAHAQPKCLLHCCVNLLEGGTGSVAGASGWITWPLGAGAQRRGRGQSPALHNLHGHTRPPRGCRNLHSHTRPPRGVSAHSDQGARPLPRPWLRGGRASAYLRDQGQWLVPKVAPTLNMPLRDVTAEEINLSFHLLSAPSLSLSADGRASRSLSSRRGPGGHPRASPPIHPPDAKPAVRMRPRRIRG